MNDLVSVSDNLVVKTVNVESQWFDPSLGQVKDCKIDTYCLPG